MKITRLNPIIGLEVHVELKTKSKMFCECSTDYFGKKPNTHTCPVCLGLPGALPVPNKKAIDWCVMIGLALNCKIPFVSKFDRKNYFYPDLPKGYQISQYDEPFCVNGHIDIDTRQHLEGETNRHLPGAQKRAQKKRIGIRRVHMEEDTAKLMHQFGTQNSEEHSLIDFNRSGVPLVEIVTEPDFGNAKEVVEYLKKLQQIVRYLGVSDADMEKGQMRLEPNISIKEISDKRQATSYELPKYKVEVKNINSFRFVEKAINYEIERQKLILESGKIPAQETRGWDENKQKTVSQRVKEEANDYRYFPEPDIPPIHLSKSQISNLKYQIGELPDQKYLRFQKNYGLSQYQAQVLTAKRTTAEYFEEAVIVNEKLKNKKEKNTDAKTAANWIVNKKIDIKNVLPAQLIWKILTSQQTLIMDTEKLERNVKEILQKNQKAIEDYKKGKVQVIGFLIGKVKQKFPKANTNQIKEFLEKYLKI